MISFYFVIKTIKQELSSFVICQVVVAVAILFVKQLCNSRCVSGAHFVTVIVEH